MSRFSSGRLAQRTLCAVAVLLLTTILCPRATAQKASPAPAGPVVTNRFWIAMDLWQTRGEAMWEISGLDVVSFGTPVQFRSKLDWEDIDSTLYIIRGGFRITDQFTIEGSYGFGDIKDGEMTDDDWLTAPQLGVRNFHESQSVSDSKGDTRMYDINLVYHHRLKSRGTNAAPVVRGFVGYQYYKDELKIRNTVQTIIDEERVFIPFEDLGFITRSTYDFEWEAIRLGGGLDYPMSSRFTFAADLAALLVLSYEGEAFWNLRSDLRPVSPNRVHDVDGGIGYDLRAALRYTPAGHVRFEAGYRILFFRAEDGEEKVYFADGTTGRSSLDKVETRRDGFFASAAFLF
jgi:hypothetical protein